MKGEIGLDHFVGINKRKLKQRLGAERSEPVTPCHGLKLEAPDGRQRIRVVSFVKEKYG